MPHMFVLVKVLVPSLVSVYSWSSYVFSFSNFLPVVSFSNPPSLGVLSFYFFFFLSSNLPKSVSSGTDMGTAGSALCTNTRDERLTRLLNGAQ